MALSDAIQGARRSAQRITWLKKNGEPEDLTDTVITLRLRDFASGTVVDSDGTFPLVDALNGVFDWVYGEQDVATAASYEAQFKATADGQYDLTYITEWSVKPAI